MEVTVQPQDPKTGRFVRRPPPPPLPPLEPRIIPEMSAFERAAWLVLAGAGVVLAITFSGAFHGLH